RCCRAKARSSCSRCSCAFSCAFCCSSASQYRYSSSGVTGRWVMLTQFATSRPIPAGGYWIPEIFLFKRQHGRAPAGALGADPKQGHPTATATGAGLRSVCRALGSWAIGSAPSQGGDNRAKTHCDPNAGSSFCPDVGYRKQRGPEKTDRVGTIG